MVGYFKDLEIFISVGEASGDYIGSSLAKELRNVCPGVRISSAGGPMMKEVSDRFIYDTGRISVTGVFEVMGKISEVLRAERTIKAYLKEKRPDAVVLVDFPDFNFRIGRFCRSVGIRVFYYVSPQVWAWREGRVRTISSFSEEIYVVFPFEEKFYRDRGVDKAVYVGHPLVDRVNEVLAKRLERSFFGFSNDFPLVLLLPGSRENEMRRHLGVMVQVARRLKDFQFAVSLPEGVEAPHCGDIPVFYGKTLELLSVSDAALVSSGTATLEAALSLVPSVVVYRLMWLSYLLGRLLVKVRHIAMPNIILGEEVFPELIQRRFSVDNTLRALDRVFKSRDMIREKLVRVKEILRGGASRAVAEKILGRVCSG